MQQWVISCFLTCLNCIIHYSDSVGPIKVVWNTQQILSSLKSFILTVLHVWHLAANVKMHKNVYCLSISITSVQTHAIHAARDRRQSGRHLRFNMSRNKEREWDSVPKEWEWREVTATLKGVLDKMYSKMFLRNCSNKGRTWKRDAFTDTAISRCPRCHSQDFEIHFPRILI